MRRKRLKLTCGACYHVINRVHDRKFMFDAELSSRFVELLRKVEAFTGVEVLTYCVMTNHFHLLVHVPERQDVCDEELLARYEALSGPTTFRQYKERWERMQKIGNEAGLERMRKQLKSRMYDLSMFMKELKQRFTQWYNWREDRLGRGTFWTDRYKSVLVEGGWKTLATMAAYIDLNPVRAGMVEDPKEHRWSGYGAAARGDKKAKEGLRKMLGEMAGKFRHGEGEDVSGLYEVMMLGKAVSKSGKAGLSAEQLEAMFGAEGMTAPWLICGQRIEIFSQGVVIGSEDYINKVSREATSVIGRYHIKEGEPHLLYPSGRGELKY